MTKKHYITPDDLQADSFQLGLEVLKSGFKPDFIVGVWRGGTPVGIAVQEILHYCDVPTDHIAIRTSSYEGIGQRGREVHVHGLDYLLENIKASDKMLLVDDVFDTGLSLKAVLTTITEKAQHNTPGDIRIATPWFKPSNNQTDFEPDYYLHTSELWLVFPHELDGLSREEIRDNKPVVDILLNKYGQ